MVEYVLDKILSFAKNFLFKRSSLVIILVTAPIAGILTFHLHNIARDFFIKSSPYNIPILVTIFGREYDLIPAFNASAVGVILWFILFLGLRSLLDSLMGKYFLWLARKQDKYECNFTMLSSAGFSEGWIIQGSPIISEDGLFFTNSNSGCLIKPGKYWPSSKNIRKWKNFKAKIVVEFPRIFHIVNDPGKIGDDAEGAIIGWIQKKEEFRQVLGIVFCAQSLEEYFMLEVWRINNKLSFRPHVRIFGNWDAPIYNSPVTIELDSNQPLAELNLELRNNVLKLKANKGLFRWVLPTSFEANLIQHSASKESDRLKDAAIIKIPFRGRVGMFGFRNYGNELAVVKNLSIEPYKD